jgi:FAD binding domain of DNA photolyase
MQCAQSMPVASLPGNHRADKLSSEVCVQMQHAQCSLLWCCRHKAHVEQGSSRAKNCDWLIMHLCIKDFFVLAARKHGASLLAEAGIQGVPVRWHADPEPFGRWCRGETGFPFVDACMRELAATGYTSNRGRQNVASFLAKALRHDWRRGAQVRRALLCCNCAWQRSAGDRRKPASKGFPQSHERPSAGSSKCCALLPRPRDLCFTRPCARANLCARTTRSARAGV